MGASKEELHAVAGLAFLFRGLPAFNLGAEIINKVFGMPKAVAQQAPMNGEKAVV
jgi:hypothetical protein